eukprot:3229968-Alexandrium_andersonii.AAC.1
MEAALVKRTAIEHFRVLDPCMDDLCDIDMKSALTKRDQETYSAYASNMAKMHDVVTTLRGQ